MSDINKEKEVYGEENPRIASHLVHRYAFLA
jgi:hypothetical protein